MNKSARPKRICYVVCYKDPNYIRTLTLVSALEKLPNVDLKVVKNSQRGLLRYLEVPFKLLVARLSFHPDTFIVGFRSQEIFWALCPAMAGKPKIFDEFINLHDYLVSEHKKFAENSVVTKMLDGYMRWVFSRCRKVLSDTEAHAQLSSVLYKVPRHRFQVVPVGADEKTFYPRPTSQHSDFEVFFFGNMLPLHGINIILDAIKLLEEQGKSQGLHFTIAGGRGNAKMMSYVQDFIKQHGLEKLVSHRDWIPYDELPKFVAAADLCLGGPFGDTGQAHRVITGKTYQFLAMGKVTLIGKIDQETPFRNKQNCLLIEQGSVKAVAEAIHWADQHKTQLPKIAIAARKLYADNFSITHISSILQKLI